MNAAGGGGLIKDDAGNWMVGFTINIGCCSTVEAELWAVIQGLKLAWDKGYRKVILLVDSSVVVNWLNNRNCYHNSQSNLVAVCPDLLDQSWDVKVQHMYREGNQAADMLANLSLAHRYLC